MFDVCSYEKTSDLDEFVDNVKLMLFCQSRVQPFIVPVMFQDNLAEVGDAYCKELTLENDSLLNAVTGNNGVYALAKRKSGEKIWEFVYVGQTDGKYARSRIRNHLIKKDERTGAQLQRVRESVSSGWQIGVSFVTIEPGGLRLLAEERIIAKEKSLLWNQKGRFSRRATHG